MVREEKNILELSLLKLGELEHRTSGRNDWIMPLSEAETATRISDEIRFVVSHPFRRNKRKGWGTDGKEFYKVPSLLDV
jgi:hypothetical protein